MSRLSLRVRLILAVGRCRAPGAGARRCRGVHLVEVVSLRPGGCDAPGCATERRGCRHPRRPATDPPGTAAPPQGDQQPTGADFCAIGRESAPGMFIEVLTAEGGVVNGDECPAFAPGHKAYSPKLTSVVASHAAGTAKPGNRPLLHGGVDRRRSLLSGSHGATARWGSPRGGGADVRHRQHAGSPAAPRALGHRRRRSRSPSSSGCGFVRVGCVRCATWSGRPRPSPAATSSLASPMRIPAPKWVGWPRRST